MNKEIFLTIGIPTFLREKSLTELLMNISVCIPYENCEVLIINNGPHLDISICMENLIKSGYVVTIINNKKNCGGQENVIRIYENALGEYVWFLGDDDRLYPDSISNIIESLIANPCDCLLFDSDAGDHPELNLKQGYYNSNTIFCGSIPLRKLMFAPLAIIRSESITQALPYARLSLGCFAPQLLLILLSNINSFFYLKRKTIMCEMANISIGQRLSILPVFLGIGYLQNINIEKPTKKMLGKLIRNEWRYYLRPRGVIISLIVAKLQGSPESVLKFSQAGFRNYPVWLAMVFPIPLIMIAILPKVIIKFIYDFAAKVLKKKTGYLSYYSSDRI
ncbi:glycosyltransferase family 2 protein [Limnohabitans sp. JirII-31]|uniref:glycosyltransferase family 2 protein n=1 Tax=Limnohabitans sp. JirII-31 TaxID=1977908 RepID=UPI0013045919|nr:glycosyltransferase family 2 protein [Limnohabitans sp. JirII-31]